MTSQQAGPAVVTGAGQGLGRAIARTLGDAGYRVVLADTNGDSVRTVAYEILDAGARALPLTVDVSDEDSVARMANTICEQWGPAGVLVNNAAVFSTLTMGPFTDITTEAWEQVMRVNVTGAFLCCRALIPHMAEVGYGKVINISSATIWTGRPNYLHYVTSKTALVGFTRALASEVGAYGVRVNALTPGSTRTEIERTTITKKGRRAMAEATALRREQTPEDLMGAILFLAGPDSDFITGQTLNVDGGLAFH